MTHYNNNPIMQKAYLLQCGYKPRFLNSLNKQQLYVLYLREERKKNKGWNVF